MRAQFFIGSFLIFVGQGVLGYYYPWSLLGLTFTIPLFLVGVSDCLNKRQTVKRNYPIFGRLRYVMEVLRPKIYQYFVESDISGRPINRNIRSVVYQRAKHVLDTSPFGTQEDVYAIGYEWINHSMSPKDLKTLNHDLRVRVGGKDCEKKYDLSLLNISAMSYGALSKNAIMALNKGAKLGGFAHNTGEGGISPFHLDSGADLIWQIGTGYFGCRTIEGEFSEEKFQENATRPSVKMIEIKLSQGAKPGHGGILPARKNTQEIAEIRGVEPFVDVLSPSHHTAFSSPSELLEFIQKLRKLSGKKPVGIKLCLGHRFEFDNLCKEMLRKEIFPDFIAVDGGEGGTGAAPLEFANSIGTPLLDALAFVDDCLKSHGLKEEIKVIASGKVFTGFDMTKAIALGADACYSARGMMLALGCIQALECNNNNCPTGIATQKESLQSGLDVGDKGVRIASYHKETLIAFAEILAASGLSSPSELERSHIYRRISVTEAKSFSQIYPERRKISKSKAM